MTDRSPTTVGGATSGPASLDATSTDPLLETSFGFASDTDWIDLARKAEEAGPPPGRLGAYELLEEIGRGGQGVVYKARQPGTGRIIAIKCFSFGPALKRSGRDRFEQEIRALVRLRHASIVGVHGAEVIDGTPILLMEHVEGGPIDRWADAAPTGARQRHEVLAAFALVCDAVSHAHQRGVIHRDLKPSNVLVDAAGVPRVLDFGIARLADDLQPGGGHAKNLTITAFAGTPAYASPEQLEGRSEPDTRSDVYGLGSMLYRVLTGSDPFDRTLPLPNLMDAVRSGTLRRPSRARPDLPSELDWVILKAMHPDPAMRYQTVDALGADLRCFMNGNPVAAHPPSRVYAARKFVRKHAGACAAVLAAGLLIVTLAGVSIAQTVRVTRHNRDLTLAVDRESRAHQLADAQRIRADAQTEAQRQMTGALADIVLRLADRAAGVPSLTAREIFGIVEPELASVPEPVGPGRAEFFSLRARVSRAVNSSAKAVEDWDRAIAETEGPRRPGDPVLAQMHAEKADALLKLARYEEARDEALLAMDTTDPVGRYWAIRKLCTAQHKLGDLPAALATAGTLLEGAGDSRSLRADALEVLACFEMLHKNFAEARPRMQAALDELSAANRAASPDSARVRVHLANICMELGEVADAEAFAREAVRIRLKSNGPMHIRTQHALTAHAAALMQLGRFAEAVQCLEQNHGRQQTYGQNSKKLACFRFKLGAAYLGAGAPTVGRRCLALAVSQGACADPDDPTVAEKVRAAESALAANTFQVNRTLSAGLGPLAWLVENVPETSEVNPDGLPYPAPDLPVDRSPPAPGAPATCTPTAPGTAW